MTTYQIRDDNFGIAKYDAESPREALLAFVGDRAQGELRRAIEESDDGSTATVIYRGERLTAVPATEGGKR